MKNILIINLLVIVILSGACRSVPPVDPKEDGGTAIGISIKVSPTFSPFGLFDRSFQKVYFVRVENEKLMSSAGVLLSTWTKGERAYILNSAPGEYVAVAGSYTVTHQGTTTTSQSGNASVSTTTGGGTSAYIVFFPEAMLKASRTGVGTGELKIMGDFKLKMSTDLSKADDAQKHYINLIAPGALNKSGFMKIFGRSHEYLAIPIKTETDAAAKNKVRQDAKADFAETKWLKILN